jgi:hypothetical protein
MARLRIRGALMLPLVLAACGGQPANNLATAHNVEDADITVPVNTAGNVDDIANAAAVPAGPAINLAPDGLTLVLDGGAARQLSFGTERDAAMKMVAAALGDPVAEAANPECGAGPLDSAEYKGALKLFFQDMRFVGWDLDGRGAGPFTTATGAGIGSTRAQMEQAIGLSIEETSLGHEFDAGGLQGLLTSARPDGKVTHLWAGTTCIFR